MVDGVSVVICVRNSHATLGGSIDSVLAEKPIEVIVVDGNSTDGSREIALNKGAILINDDGRGIAHARHLGVMAARGRHILFVGPDNILPAGFIADLLEAMEKWQFVAAAPQTRVSAPQTFWDRGLDFRLLCMENEPGPRDVIGTPTLYDASIFQYITYNECAGACDDTDIGMQLREHGLSFGIVPVLVYDQNGLTRNCIWKKFKLYGTGDSDFYRLHSPKWTGARKLQSLTHPLRQSISLGKIALRNGSLGLIAWLMFAMVARYVGWIQKSMKRKARTPI